LVWPSEKYNNFDELVELAIELSLPIYIESYTSIILENTILHKKNSKTLHIIGIINKRDEINSRPIISCSDHSIFKLTGRKPFLILENLILNHNCFREDKRDIGAAVFGLYKSNNKV
jgi:hypothetical protein